jgi:serine/threonine-protein kinase
VTVISSAQLAAAPGPADTIGRYDLLLELGRGGMAVLYLARARGVGGFARMFAIKRILPHLAADPVFVDMFLDEGRITAGLSHPNLCPVFEIGADRGELFLVMDYLDGVAWEALAAAAPRDRRGLALAAGVLAQACEGLHHAHTFRDVDGTPQPVVHRDVSPQNLFVSADGTCRVLDFGVSKIATDPRRTRSGVRKGKLPYMAPEQIRGEPLDGRTDVWALGAVLWEALVGARLFDRETDFLTYTAITEAEIPPVTAVVPDAGYPAAVDRVLGRALARDRDQRYATARELGHDLHELARDGGVGGAASRDAIAEALAQLCGDQLAARRQAIAAALGRRAAAEARRAARAADDPASDPSRAATGDDRDAAETVSMAMRRDAIVVHARRRRWPAAAAGLAAIAGAVAVAATLHGAVEPHAPAAAPGSAQVGGESGAGPATPTSAVGGDTERRVPAGPATASPSGASPSGANRAPGGRSPAHPRPPARVAAPPASGWYAIDSAPYATIFVDDQKIGDTPLDRVSLPTGKHRVRAVLADGRERTFAIQIAADQKISQGVLRW